MQNKSKVLMECEDIKNFIKKVHNAFGHPGIFTLHQTLRKLELLNLKGLYAEKS